MRKVLRWINVKQWPTLSSALLCGALAVPIPAAGQDSEFTISKGVKIEDVISASDGDQRYAVYLSASYDAETTWPVLVLMDPRGRALIPLDLFVRAAEEFGYIVLSSYGTLSDDATAFEQNDRALNAMIVDAQARFSGDPERIYLVGFSGTAHYAWTVAAQLDGSLAGIVGVGGGLPAYTKPIQMGMAMKRPFAFFGIAGIGDFNYDGVRWLGEALDTTRVRHRFVTHGGLHQWPPEEIAFEAVEWMQLQAMKAGLIRVDREFVRDLGDRYLDEAIEIEKESSDPASAYRRYREIVADFEEFGLADHAADRVESLEADQDVLDELHRRDQLSRRVQLYKISVRNFRIEYRERDQIMDRDEALDILQVEELLDQADDPDFQSSGAARRMLASAYANTSFYEPREYLAEGDFERAAGVLEIAETIYPGVPRTCYQLAQALAQIGEHDSALEALSCALNANWVSHDSANADPLLAPLHDLSGFQDLLDPDAGSE